MKLDDIKKWVKSHAKQVTIGAAAAGVAGLAYYRNRQQQAAAGLVVTPQYAAGTSSGSTDGTDAASGAYDQFTGVLGQLGTAQQQQADQITAALGQIYGQQQDTYNSLAGLIGGLTEPASPTAPRPASSTYTFAPGDTVQSVASKLGTTVGQLLAANPASGANFDAAGHTVTVPTASTPAAGPTPTVRYVFKAGDTIASVAAAFGMTPAQLKAANPKSGANFDAVGHAITIPGK